MKKSFIQSKAANTGIIGGSDGPTAVFFSSSKHKPNMKQNIQRKLFELRKKWYALWIKPNPHTMEEVAAYIQKKYRFKRVPKKSKKYQRLYNELRSSFIMQYEPQLLGEYAVAPELKSEKEADINKFLEQMQLRQEKAKEVPEELFALEYYLLKKKTKGVHMEIQLESRFGYIGGSASGKFISKYHKIYKDAYKYYGVSKADIVNNSKRYQDLLRKLAIRH